MEEWEKEFIKKSSVPLIGGGDTHIHPFGPKEDDFKITTRIPLGPGLDPVDIHDGPFHDPADDQGVG